MTGRGRGYFVMPLNTPEQEHDFLKNQAQALGEELEQIEARIEGLEVLRAKPAVRSK
jgi:hypothetical protein